MLTRFYVRPVKIIPQRDEFKVHGKVNPVVDFEFMASSDKGEDVVAFKRFTVEADLEWAGKTYDVELVFHVRSNFIRVMAKSAPLSAEMIAAGLVRDLGRFKIRPPGMTLRIESNGHDRWVDAKYPVVHRSDRVFEFATNDALWFCAVLHDARDRKAGFEGDGSLSPRDSPFIG